MNIYEKAKVLEKQCHRAKRKWKLWEFLENMCKARMVPLAFDSLILNAITLVINFALYILLMGVIVEIGFDDCPFVLLLLITAAPYYLIFYILYRVTDAIEMRSFEALKNLESDVNAELQNYYSERCEDANMYDGWIKFPNGVSVSTTDDIVAVKLARKYVGVKLYKTISGDMYINGVDDGELLNKSIASVAFNNNFIALAPKGQRVGGIEYLTPSAQVGLINFYAGNSFDDKTQLLEVSGDILILRSDRKDVRGGLEKVTLIDRVIPSITDKVKKIDLYVDTLSAVAYKLSRRFDTDMRALRGGI